MKKTLPMGKQSKSNSNSVGSNSGGSKSKVAPLNVSQIQIEMVKSVGRYESKYKDDGDDIFDRDDQDAYDTYGQEQLGTRA